MKNQLSRDRTLPRCDDVHLKHTVQGHREYRPHPKRPGFFDRIGRIKLEGMYDEQKEGKQRKIGYKETLKLETLQEQDKMQGTNQYPTRGPPRKVDEDVKEEMDDVVKKITKNGPGDRVGEDTAGKNSAGKEQSTREQKIYRAGKQTNNVLAVTPLDDDGDVEEYEDAPNLEMARFVKYERKRQKQQERREDEEYRRQRRRGTVSRSRLANLMSGSESGNMGEVLRANPSYGTLAGNRGNIY